MMSGRLSCYQQSSLSSSIFQLWAMLFACSVAWAAECDSPASGFDVHSVEEVSLLQGGFQILATGQFEDEHTLSTQEESQTGAVSDARHSEGQASLAEADKPAHVAVDHTGAQVDGGAEGLAFFQIDDETNLDQKERQIYKVSSTASDPDTYEANHASWWNAGSISAARGRVWQLWLSGRGTLPESFTPVHYTVLFLVLVSVWLLLYVLKRAHARVTPYDRAPPCNDFLVACKNGCSEVSDEKRPSDVLDKTFGWDARLFATPVRDAFGLGGDMGGTVDVLGGGAGTRGIVAGLDGKLLRKSLEMIGPGGVQFDGKAGSVDALAKVPRFIVASPEEATGGTGGTDDGI